MGRYYLILVMTNFCVSLTVDTVLKKTEGMIIRDIYGNPHNLRSHHVNVIIGVGWASFLGSWVINIAYYNIHPSSVDMFSLSNKRILHVFGWDVFAKGRKEPQATESPSGSLKINLWSIPLISECF